MKTRTNVRAGGSYNHNETLLREPIRARALKVKSGVRVGKATKKAAK